MSSYPFDLLAAAEMGKNTVEALASRPFTKFKDTHKESAEFYVPSKELRTAINTAVAMGMPLLLTGEPGTGKTQAAYYAARVLGLGSPLEFIVKSTSQGRDLLYTFDSVRYFRDSWAQAKPGSTVETDSSKLKRRYVEPGRLWEALASRDGLPHSSVKLLLIDEIDKAPKDFPNDLLHELDELRFTITETGEDVPHSPREDSGRAADTKKSYRPIVFITSNSERRLPEPFLRRCVYHNIDLTPEDVSNIVKVRVKAGLFEPLKVENNELHSASAKFLNSSIDVWGELRSKVRHKQPSVGEYLDWLHAFLHEFGVDQSRLKGPLEDLDFLQLLIKVKEDLKIVSSKSAR